MTRSERDANVPGDRPRGAPRSALGAGFSSFLLAIGLGPLALELYGAWHGEGLLLLIRNIPSLAVVETAIFLPVWCGLGQGKLWAVRVFRVLGWLLVLFCVAMAVCVVLMSTGLVLGTSKHWRADLEVVACGMIPLTVCAILLTWGLLRVAWFDPASLPDQWEPPLISEWRRRGTVGAPDRRGAQE